MKEIKIMLLNISNIQQLFGQRATAYVIFDGIVNGKKTEIGISYNSLQRKGFDTSAEGLRRLKGCTVTVKDFVDRTTGEISYVVDRVHKSVKAIETNASKDRLVLLNSLNYDLIESEEFQEKSLEIISAAKAKSEQLEKKEILANKRAALLARLASSVGAVVTETPKEEEKPEDTTELEIETPETESTDEVPF